MIAIGEFRERLTIQRKDVTRNSIGDEVATWSDVATTWAKVMPLRGNAFFAANQEQHTIDARFLIRSRTGMTEAMRLVWNGENYDIKNIITGTGTYLGTLEIHAVHGVKDGR